MDNQIRAYLAAVVDPAIRTNDRLFADAKSDVFDSFATRLDPSTYLFDEDFYVSRRLRCQVGLTPIRDFFENGARLGLSPHPILNPDFVARQIEIHADNIPDDPTESNVLTQILGTSRDIAPNPFFDIAAYRASVERARGGPLPDVPPVGTGGAVNHYLGHWRQLQSAEVLVISSFFDPYFYNLIAARQGFELVDPLSHYLSKLPNERTDCNSRFDNAYYRSTWGVKSEDCLWHFITVGGKRANLPNPYADVELGLHHMTAPSEVIEQLLVDYVRLQPRSS